MLVLLSFYTSISTKYNASGKHEPAGKTAAPYRYAVTENKPVGRGLAPAAMQMQNLRFELRWILGFVIPLCKIQRVSKQKNTSVAIDFPVTYIL